MRLVVHQPRATTVIGSIVTAAQASSRPRGCCSCTGRRPVIPPGSIKARSASRPCSTTPTDNTTLFTSAKRTKGPIANNTSRITRRFLRVEPVPVTTAQMSPPYNKLTYYSAGTPNGLKPAIVLEELGLTYETKAINIMKNEQKEPWFLEINPNGRIPALKDGDLRVFESGAIMLYLTDLYDKDKKFTYEYGTADYYEMMSWLMFQMGGIGPMQGQANHFRAMAPVYSAYGIKRYVDETKRLYGVLEIRLGQADWLVGDKYTIADMANFAWVRGGPLFLDIDLAEYPGVDKWVRRIEGRPAVQRAKEVPAGAARSDEQLKEMIGAMKAKMDARKGTGEDEAKM